MSADNYILISELSPEDKQTKDDNWLVKMVCASTGKEIRRLGAFKSLKEAIKQGKREFVEYGLHFNFKEGTEK